MNKLNKIMLLGAVIVIAFFFLIRIVVLFVMQSAPKLGVEEGKLVDCPEYPACVSSYADPLDEVHYVQSIANDMSIGEAKGKISSIMEAITGAVLVAEEEKYLHYEIKVAPFGFIDDVEFYLPADRSPIELRSSARVPYYDFDVNRDRVEMLRDSFVGN